MRRKCTAIVIAAALTGGSLAALADTTAARDAAAPGAVVNAPPPNYADSMARLQEASDRLREAIRHMAQHPRGDRRDAAIDQAQRALFDTQQAMIHLPPQLYERERASELPNFTVAMERLQQAAQKLRESVQAMAQHPAGERRNAAMREANAAIHETQQAMVKLPLDMRSQLGAEIARAERASPSTPQEQRAVASMAPAPAPERDAFARIDRNGDGYISRGEWQQVYGGAK